MQNQKTNIFIKHTAIISLILGLVGFTVCYQFDGTGSIIGVAFL